MFPNVEDLDTTQSSSSIHALQATNNQDRGQETDNDADDDVIQVAKPPKQKAKKNMLSYQI
jgi:hypothetical protein